MSQREYINKNLFIFISLFFLSIAVGNAQISIRFPYEKSVFQRNINNIGNIQVSGILDQDADRIEGRLVPRVSGQGTATDWKSIDNSIDGLSFTGIVEGNGGWYRLEIRSIRNNQIIATNAVERVGIGEVFLIGGQSNGQGDGFTPNAKGATDERVLAFDNNYFNHTFYTVTNFPEFLDPSKFTKIESNTNIGPLGFSAWCYGELGDLLVKRLNVPVMFYNAAFSGTSSENWATSINGGDTYHTALGGKFEKFFPYISFKRTLQSIVSTYGFRSVLWHQGESDASINYGEQSYINNIKAVIQESRNNTGVKMPWVICRVSREGGKVNSTIISAQNKIIATTENVWSGPTTDNIQPNRPDGVHFENSGSVNGLSLLAEGWNQSLTAQFFQQALPVIPSPLAEIKYACNSQSEATLMFDKNYLNYQWSTGSTSSQIKTGTGDITAILRDGYGNYVFSNRLIVSNIYPKDKPTISPVVSLIGCVGKTLDLQSTTSKYDVNWNNGKIGNTLTVSGQDIFFAFYRSAQGCLSPRSNDLFTKFVNPPAKPNIELVTGDGYECLGNPIKFRVNNPQNFDILWSNGQKDPEIVLNTKFASPLKVNLYSNYDCPSIDSDSASYAFVALPKTPLIEKTGPFSLRANIVENVQRFDWFLDNKYLTSQTNRDFLFGNDGLYSVKAVKTYKTPGNRLLECFSGLSTQTAASKNEKLYGINVFPNPSYDGKVNIASASELKNVKVTLYNSIGQKELEATYPSILLPIELNLKRKRPLGLYYLKLTYSGLTRTFPLVFE